MSQTNLFENYALECPPGFVLLGEAQTSSQFPIFQAGTKVLVGLDNCWVNAGLKHWQAKIERVYADYSFPPNYSARFKDEKIKEEEGCL